MKILTLVPKNYVTTLVFVKRIEGKIEYKMVNLEVVETHDTIKFCVKLGYKPTEMFSLLQRGGGCFRNEIVHCLSGTSGLSKDKRAFKTALGVDAGR